MVLQSRRHVLCRDGKTMRVLRWESPNFLSVPFTSPLWFQQNARPISGGVSSLNTRQRGRAGEELLMSNLTQLRMGNAGSGEGLNATTKTAATHGGNSSSPSALPWLSVSQVLLKQMMSLGELLVASPFYDLPTCFFNSNHNEEVM